MYSGLHKKKGYPSPGTKKNVCRPLLVLSLVWRGAPLPTFDQTTSSSVHHFFQREQADRACGSSAHGQTDSQLNILLLLCSYICSMYYVRYIEYKHRSARKSDMMNTSNPPQADVDREQRKHKYKILRLVLRNVNVSRNIFIPASRFSSHTHEHKFFHALAKRKRFTEHFHSRV